MNKMMQAPEIVYLYINGWIYHNLRSLAVDHFWRDKPDWNEFVRRGASELQLQD